MIACPPAIVQQYAAYDAAFSRRDVAALQRIETADFRDTDPDGTRRDLKGASQNQRNFFALVKTMRLSSSVQCRRLDDDTYSTIATMSLSAVYVPPHSHPHQLQQIYINHDVWRRVNGHWRLASQTTVQLDGADNGKPIHLRLSQPGRLALELIEDIGRVPGRPIVVTVAKLRLELPVRFFRFAQQRCESIYG